MTHNLILHFIMREAGILVNDIPKIHVKGPDERNHSLYFPSSDVMIPLSLWGVFSYFLTSSPTIQQCNELYDSVLMLTSEGPWNPHTDVFARNEENMLNREGNIVEAKHRAQIILADIADDDVMIASAHISHAKSAQIDAILTSRCDEPSEHATRVPFELDDVNAHLHNVSPTLTPSLGNLLHEQCKRAYFGC